MGFLFFSEDRARTWNRRLRLMVPFVAVVALGACDEGDESASLSAADSFCAEALERVEEWKLRYPHTGFWRGAALGAYILAGRLQEADEFTEASLAWFLSDGDRRFFLKSAAWAYSNATDFVRSEEMIRRALALVPETPDLDAMDWLGWVLALQGRYAEAAEVYESALDVNPRFENGLLGQATVFLARGEHAQAER